MTEPGEGTRTDPWRRLLEAEGLYDPDAIRRRKGVMREVLEEERTFTRRIRRVCLVAWGLSLLLPLGLVSQRALMFRPLGGDGPTAEDWALYFGSQLLTFLGAVAAVVAIITLVAWLLRSRTTSIASLQLRLTDLEAELAALRREEEEMP